jgi:hypothetical protein
LSNTYFSLTFASFFTLRAARFVAEPRYVIMKRVPFLFYCFNKRPVTYIFHWITGTLLQSKAQVASFCLELAKKLDMKYKSPPLPVDLALHKSALESGSCGNKLAKALGSLDNDVGDEVAAMFQISK